MVDHTEVPEVPNKTRTSKKLLIILALALSLALVGFGINKSFQDSHRRSKQRDNALAELSKAQAAASAQEARNTQTDDNIVEEEFADISDTEFARPSCKDLENRPAIVITSDSCRYNLRALGKVRVGVVFIYERSSYSKSSYKKLISSNPNNKQSLAYTNTYLKAQAKRYKVGNPLQLEMTFLGPYRAARPVTKYYYRENGYKILSIFDKTANNQKISQSDYDIINYVLLDSVYGGVAFPSLHRSFTYNDDTPIPTFVHETLHLFGASDKYNNNDCSTIGLNDPFKRYDGKLPGSDIMCSTYSLSNSNINDITAREIGWAN